ncbi:MAG: restriction endonuclease [Ruminococcus sp.]|nr:restriction endonuclease [Ruminococcus sp.]
MHWSKPILFGNYTLDWHFLLLIICCVIGCWILTKAYQNRRQKSKDKALCRKNMHAIDHMTGEEFEALLAAQFRQKGFRAETTPKSKDYGADLVMRREKKKIVVQAKRYSGKVGIKAVQEIVAAREYYDADLAVVCTNSFFTSSAKNLTKKCHVVLIDRERFYRDFQKAGSDKQ